MPIEVLILGESKEVAGPIVTCDVCLKRIENAAEGNYQWIVADLEPWGGKAYFTHKWCAEALPVKTGTDRDAWAPLVEFPMRLAKNLGLPLVQVDEQTWQLRTHFL